jgi:hypothetical protein
MKTTTAAWELAGLQYPVNPVILSKTRIEPCQTCAAIKPLNAAGWQPVLQHQFYAPVDFSEGDRRCGQV